jgi:hypothetical protein
MNEVMVDVDSYHAKLKEQRDMHADGEAALAGQLGAAVKEIVDLNEKIAMLEAGDGKKAGKAEEESMDDPPGRFNGRDKNKAAVSDQ